MISTLVVDDHRSLRESLVEQLELTDNLLVRGACASAEEALAWMEREPVGLVLLDIWMDGMGGIEGCREIKSRWPATKVLILTSNQEQQAVVSCLLAGADGYVVKKSGRKELMRALTRIIDGNKFLDPEVTDIVLTQLRGTPRAKSNVALSPRENETLSLIAAGLTNRAIGERLSVSEKTARNYVARVLDKLGFQRRSEAAAWAGSSGLLS